MPCWVLIVPPSRKHDGVHILGQRPHAGHVITAAQVEERPHVDLPDAGVDQECRRQFVPLQQILDAMQIIRQALRWDADVLEECQRLGRAAQTVQRRERCLTNLPEALGLGFVSGDAS